MYEQSYNVYNNILCACNNLICNTVIYGMILSTHNSPIITSEIMNICLNCFKTVTAGHVARRM